MMDHGGDAANVVVGLAADGAKTTLKASAEIIKQILILCYQNYQQKAGRTNIKHLLKMLDSGERVCDIVIPKEKIEKLSAIAKKHAIHFAVAERKEGDFVIYYPESESTQIANALHELATFEGRHIDSISRAERKTPDGIATITFDSERPDDILELRNEIAEDGRAGTVIYLHQKEKEGQSLTMEQASEITEKMRNPKTMDIDDIKLEDPDRSNKIWNLVSSYIKSLEHQEGEQEKDSEAKDRKSLQEWKEEVKKVQTLSKEGGAKETQHEIQIQVKETLEREAR